MLLDRVAAPALTAPHIERRMAGTCGVFADGGTVKAAMMMSNTRKCRRRVPARAI
jgi:hypothetical protein